MPVFFGVLVLAWLNGQYSSHDVFQLFWCVLCGFDDMLGVCACWLVFATSCLDSPLLFEYNVC